MAAAVASSTPQRSSSPAPGFALPRLIPSLPIGVLNSINPFASSDPAAKPETKEAAPSESLFRRSVFGTILKPTSAVSAEEGRPKHERNESTVMFAEPLVTDSDDASREGSVTYDTRRPKRSRNKPKTSFSICHPAPASLTRHKLHRRPRSLLQLHRLSAKNRPEPAFEVVPSANFSARLTKSIIKTYKTKHGLCYNDMVLLRAEKYYNEGNDEEQDSRDIVALICRGKKDETLAPGRSKICMSNGEEWEAGPHSSGGYEFFTIDDHGLGITVRWVPKKSREIKSGNRKFNFSTIATGTRRHPVIATLSDTGLDIFDTYKIPDPTVSTPLSTPVHTDSFLTQAMEDEDGSASDECTTDERLRSIITVTAIYVAFKENWSPYLKDDEKDACNGKAAPSPQKDLGTPIISPPGSPLQRAMDKRGSVRSVSSSLLRRSSILSSSNRHSTQSVDSITSTDHAASETQAKTGRTRSDSTSTVLVHRAASNRRRNNQQATWRPDLLNAQNTVPETSREDIARADKPKRVSTFNSVASSGRKGKATRRSSVHDDTEDTEQEEEDDEDVSPTRKDDKHDSSTISSSTVPSQTPAQSPTVRKSKSGRWRKFLCIS